MVAMVIHTGHTHTSGWVPSITHKPYLVAIRDNRRHGHTHGPVVPHEVVAHGDVLHVHGRLAV